jgi:hypothetical protein
MNKLLLSLLGILFVCHIASSQSVEDIRAEVSGDLVIITYDLKGDISGQKFDVEVFSRHNNYVSALKLVSGDVGKNIEPGFNRRVEWKAKDELKNFSGTIDFEIRATLIYSPVTILHPSMGSSFKKGKPMEIRWKGGLSTEKFNIEVYQGTLKVQEYLNQSNDTKKVTWMVPKTSSKGMNYEVGITSINNPSNLARASDLKLKSGGGAVKILVPMVLIGGAAYYFLFMGETEDPGTVDPVNDLPDAPSFPIN